MYLKSLVVSLLVFSFSYSQSESSLICKNVDEFTDKVSYSTIDMMINYEDGGDMSSEGFIGILFLNEEKGKIGFSSFYVKVLGIEGCVDEGSTLDIIFENGEKTQLVNWKDFDCEGKNYFRLPNGKLDLFKSSSIKGYKYTNKRNYDTMISKDNLDDKGKNYLKDTLLEIDKINNGEVVVGMCKD
jgi:hypothetical protein